MKKPLIIAAVALAAISVAACRQAPVERTTAEKSYRLAFTATEVVYINVWTDPDTGCQYLVTDEGFAQPRMSADGTQRCPSGEYEPSAPLPAPPPAQ